MYWIHGRRAAGSSTLRARRPWLRWSQSVSWLNYLGRIWCKLAPKFKIGGRRSLLSPLNDRDASLDANAILDFHLIGNTSVLQRAVPKGILVSDFVEAEL